MSKATKTNIRNTRIGNIATMDWSHLGIEIFQINAYQLRFVQKNHKIDYYPTSGRYFDINKEEWGQCGVSEIALLFKTV